MGLTRRGVLALGGAILPAFAAGRLAAADNSASVLTVVIDGSPRDAIPIALAFLDRELPVAVIVDEMPDGVAWLDNVAGHSGLLEILAPIPDTRDQPRYAQMRGAEMRRAQLARAVPKGIPAVGLIDRDGGAGLDLSAYRSAGFRVLVTPDGTPGVAVNPVGRGQMILAGGATLGAGQDAPPLNDRAAAMLRPGRASLVMLSAAGADTAAVAGLVDWLARAVGAGTLTMLRPIDHLLVSLRAPERHVAVVIDAPDATPALTDLLRRLDGAQVPATLAGPIAVLDRLGHPDACLRDGPKDAANRCVLGAARGAADVVLRPPGPDTAWTGMGADARLHVATRPWTGQLPAEPLADAVLLLRPDDYASDRQRARIADTLSRHMADDSARLWTVAGWADHVVAPDALLTRFQAARARKATDPVRAEPPGDAARAAFLADAAAAWGYLVARTDDRTGHAATTLATRPYLTVNSHATLWDSGSQIHGTLAAARLGLITADDCAARIAMLVGHLPTMTVDGARLPPAIFDIRTLKVVRPDFDICDLGRFLLAMDAAVAAGVLSQGTADAVWQGWDIAAAIRDNRLHSLRAGRWHDITVSHCTEYIHAAFARRGMDVVNPYLPAPPGAAADRAMTDLAITAAAGPIAAEPWLLALVEGQDSRVSRLLADILFDAQLAWFEDGGGYKSVSETPLNQPPWFAYQGLDLGILGPDAWTTNSIGAPAEMRSPAFQRDTEVISAKAAYLWRAIVPHRYSDDLVAMIRDNCRSDDGFNVGIYAASGQPLAGYFDINTNGIILSALAHVLDAPARPAAATAGHQPA